MKNKALILACILLAIGLSMAWLSNSNEPLTEPDISLESGIAPHVLRGLISEAWAERTDWTTDAEISRPYADGYGFLHGGPAATDGTAAGYLPKYLQNIEDALLPGNLSFSTTVDNATITSATAGITIVYTQDLVNANSDRMYWLDGWRDATAWTVAQVGGTLTLAYSPTDRKPVYTDGRATLTVTCTGTLGSTSTLTCTYQGDTFAGQAVSAGTAKACIVTP